jgi:hypothetical protein
MLAASSQLSLHGSSHLIRTGSCFGEHLPGGFNEQQVVFLRYGTFFRAMCRIVLTLLREEAFLNRKVRINLGRCSVRRVGLFLGGSWRGLAAASWVISVMLVVAGKLTIGLE